MNSKIFDGSRPIIFFKSDPRALDLRTSTGAPVLVPKTACKKFDNFPFSISAIREIKSLKFPRVSIRDRVSAPKNLSKKLVIRPKNSCFWFSSVKSKIWIALNAVSRKEPMMQAVKLCTDFDQMKTT